LLALAGLACIALIQPVAAHTGIVWDGPPMTFTKANDTDENEEANQDRITDRVWLTRAYRQGIFNIAAEEAHNEAAPVGTEWAYGTTESIDSLTFTTWEKLHGGRDEGGPRNLVNKDAVLHLVEDNIYIDIKFISWTRNGGGGFAYIRSTRPEGGAGVSLSVETSEADLGGGEGSVYVITGDTDVYAVSTAESWITVISESSVTGPSTVRYRIEPNPNPVGRTGVIQIGEKTLTVSQPGMTAALEVLTETELDLGSAGGSGTVRVISQEAFRLMAPSWIDVFVDASASAGSEADAALAVTSPETASGEPGVTTFNWIVSNDAPLQNRIGRIEMVDAEGSVLGSITLTQTGGDGAGVINMSARTQVGTGEDILIPGLVVGGAGTTKVVVRGVGPTLGDLGVADVLPDPQIQLYEAGGDRIGQNTSWRGDEAILQALFDELGAFSLTSDLDSATLLELDPGAYTIQLKDEANASGVGLVEIYVVDGSARSGLKNLSARAEVGSGDRVMIPGIVVGGNQSIEVLFRGVGPSLGALGVSGALADPEIEVFDAGGRAIGSNDNWNADLAATFTQVGAFALEPESKDAAILLTLPPGAYTAQIRGKGEALGVALLEVYFLVDF
jgi:hypothetical protein